jgi:hypothetical protein
MPKQLTTTRKKGGEPTNRFRLLAGIHTGADYSHEFSEEEIELAKDQGRPLRYPSKQYKAGDVIETDKDLVHLFGATKFQYLGPAKGAKKGSAGASDIDADEEGNAGEGQLTDPTPLNLEEGFVHPHGQVNTGFQASGSKDHFNNPVSGSISKQELEERGLIHELPDKSHKVKGAAGDDQPPKKKSAGKTPASHSGKPTPGKAAGESARNESKGGDGKPGAAK